VLRDCGLIGPAIDAYRAACALNPGHTRSHHRLGHSLYAIGAHQEAAEVFSRWLAAEPGNPIATHMLAACSGENVPARASDAYIRTTFDGFASSFDDVLLHQLDYRAPQLVLEVLAPVLGKGGALSDVLDAGCGTGLCGPLLRPYARSLTGVDLSEGMLSKARARKIYDHLHQAEITDFLGAHALGFDVIVAADMLCYFGDLHDVVVKARSALRPGGSVAFTVERGEDVQTHRIEPHGRYSHSRNYVERVLREAGFATVHLVGAILRRERGTDVEGWVVHARVPGTVGE
jgi:predicted TPR repeat methyltransferase